MTDRSLASALRNSSSATSLAIALSLPLVLGATGAYAGDLPSGGHYVAGSGSISKKGGSVTVNQNSNTGIINWNTFSIAKGKTVDFNNGSGATLNRVTGGNLSRISGSLSASGSVYVINQAGVVVSRSGRVDTGGSFVASTRDQSNSDFENGKRKFNGTSKGDVVNAGVIRSANGDVALIGHNVNNSGKLSAANGTASLSAGNHVLLKPEGSRILINGGNGNATNSGVVAGAQAQLNAAGGNVYALAGNNGGIIRATGTKTVDGHIWLTSQSGNTSIAGRVAAHNADGSGGTIEATGARLDVQSSARIDASGTKGGTVLLGGDIHGGKIASANLVKDHLSNATHTSVAKGARITANSSKGAGGNVVVWSNSRTKFDGSISAKGAGAEKGGFSEVSSHNVLGFRGHVDLTSGTGKVGTLLLDPYNVTIEDAATAHGSFSGGTFSPSGSGSVLDVKVLENTLNTASVVVDTGSAGPEAGNIDVLSSITWGSDRALTLNAGHSINLDANVNVLGAGFLILNTNAGGGSGGTLNFGNGAHVDYGPVDNGGRLNINGSAYNLLYSIADVQNVNSGLGGNYALATSINGSSASSWTPLGTSGGSLSGSGFAGTFEGLGNNISGVTVDGGTNSNVGLFGYVSGTVRDLGLIQSSVTGANNVGGLIGTLSSTGSVTNSFATSSVTGTGNYAGGLVGLSLAGSKIVRSFANGNVSGGGYVGGLVGGGSGSAVYSYASGNVTGTGNNVGGFAGANNGTMLNDYATGAVSGGTNVGGFVGWNRASGVIGIAYENGAATGTSVVGGFVGLNDGIAGNSAANKIVYNTDANPVSGYGTNNLTVRQQGLTAAQMADTTMYPTGFTFATTPGASSGWVVVDLNGSLNNAGSATGGTTPMLLSEYSLNVVTPHQLQLMELDPNASYALETSYLNMGATGGSDVWTGAGFIPVGGNSASPFEGAFAGNGGTIANLKINDSAGTNEYVGLFGDMEGSVSNLTLKNFNISSTYSGANIATLAGYADGSISHVDATSGVVTGSADPYAGGLVGDNDYLINASSANVTVNNTDTSGYAGGLVGYNDGTITKSSAAGLVRGQGGDEIGGLVGFNEYVISNSFATGNVVGTNNYNSEAGGLVGYNDEGQITNSYATGDVTVVSNNSGYVGGLVGEDYYGQTSNSYATGAVTGTDVEYLGGLMGYEDEGVISGSHATGMVRNNYISATETSVGGLVGYLYGDTDGAISNSYATGAVVVTNPESYVGGLVGYGDDYSWIQNSYATGRVRATGDYSEVGGLVGYLGDYSHINNSHASGDVTITSNDTYAGGLVGYMDEYSHIGSSFASGNVTGSGSAYLGGLVGYQYSYSTIDGSHATGNVTADGRGSDSYIGGLVGYAYYENAITNSFAHGNVTGDNNSYAGGLVGYNDEYLVLTDSHATGDVTGYVAGGLLGQDDDDGFYNNVYATGNVLGVVNGGYSYAGGLIGYADYSNMITNAYATGDVNGGSTNASDSYAGGLIGYAYVWGGITSTYATGSVRGAYYAGGLLGYQEADVTDSYATGAVVAGAGGYGGGLVGENDSYAITGSYATGKVSGLLGTDTYVGGLVGENSGTIDHSYATGNVFFGGTEPYAGGLVGYNDGDITYAYSTGYLKGDGTATSSADVGGLIGYNNGGTIDQVYSAARFYTSGAATVGGLIGASTSSDPITNAYWDITKSGSVTSSAGGVGLTTTQLQNGHLPAGFSGSDWIATMGSYPILK